MRLLEFIFWAGVAGVVYAYAVYPVVLLALARVFGRKADPAPLPDDALPTVTVLIAAHNEESVIEARVRNALELDYPQDRLDVLVASDGSTDATAEIVRRYAGRRVRLLDFGVQRGKATTLNSAFSEARGDVVILSDANTHTDPRAARHLVRWLADRAVGVVCGKLVLTDPASGRNVDGLYWKYETFLKQQESRLGALLGANGAIYAIRRELLRPIPPNTIIDDFVLPLVAKLRTGCQIVFDRQALAQEESAPDVGSEFRRRARIGAGGWQAIGILWKLLNPQMGWVAFTFFSHKVLRWVCPLFLLSILVANVALAFQQPLYRWALAAQAFAYAAALLVPYVPPRLPLARVLRLASMFVAMNAALLVGFFRWLRGPQSGIWSRTQRLGESGVSSRLATSAAAAAGSPQGLCPADGGVLAGRVENSQCL